MPKAKLSKKLVRGQDQKILGVCSGVAEYLNVDVVVVRLVWVLITAITGFIPGIAAYVVAGLVMPEK